MPDDYDALYLAEVGDPQRLVTYRHRGIPPSAELYPQTLWSDVFVQFVVSPLDNGGVAGLVTCYGWNQRNQTAKLAVVSAPASVANADELTMRGLLVFLDYLFAVQPIRKLYGEVLEWNRHRFESMVSKGATLEGVLVDHDLHGDSGVDLHIYGITRRSWDAFRSEREASAQVPPSVAVREELGVAHLEDVELSTIDSLGRVALIALLEDDYGLLVADEELYVIDDDGFRSLLHVADEHWARQLQMNSADLTTGSSQ